MLAAVGVATIAALAGSAAADASWTHTNSGTAAAVTATLIEPTTVTATTQCLLFAATVTVGWLPSVSPFVESYEVLRSNSPGGPYTSVGTVAAGHDDEFEDAVVGLGASYFYVVRSTAQGWTSVNSNEATVTTPVLCL